MTEDSTETQKIDSDCPNPKCKSNETEGGFIEVNGNKAYQAMHCKVCGTQWDDEYVLSGPANIQLSNEHLEGEQ